MLVFFHSWSIFFECIHLLSLIVKLLSLSIKPILLHVALGYGGSANTFYLSAARRSLWGLPTGDARVKLPACRRGKLIFLPASPEAVFAGCCFQYHPATLLTPRGGGSFVSPQLIPVCSFSKTCSPRLMQPLRDAVSEHSTSSELWAEPTGPCPGASCRLPLAGLSALWGPPLQGLRPSITRAVHPL